MSLPSRIRPVALCSSRSLPSWPRAGPARRRRLRKAGPPKGRTRVALVMKSLANEFFVTMADGAKAHQAASGGAYTLIVNGIRNESDLSQQVALVEQMMAQGVDAIVIAPADSRALVPVLAKAQRQKIVVVNIDNKLDEADAAAGRHRRAVRRPRQPRRRACRRPGPGAGAGEGQQGRHPRRHPDRLQRPAAAARLRGRDARGGHDGGRRCRARTGSRTRPTRSPRRCCASIPISPRSSPATTTWRSARRRRCARPAGSAQVAVVGFDNIAAVQQLLKEGGLPPPPTSTATSSPSTASSTRSSILKGETTPQDRQTPVDVITAPK